MLKKWLTPFFQYWIKINNIKESVSHTKNTHFSFFEWALYTLDKKLLHNTSINQKSQLGKHYLSFLEAKCQCHQTPPKCDKVRHWQIRLWPWQWILSFPGSEGQKDNDSSSHGFLKRHGKPRWQDQERPWQPFLTPAHHALGLKHPAPCEQSGSTGQQPDDDDQLATKLWLAKTLLRDFLGLCHKWNGRSNQQGPRESTMGSYKDKRLTYFTKPSSWYSYSYQQYKTVNKAWGCGV